MAKNKPPTNYHLPITKPALLVIVGETGSGKSALAMRIAKKFNGEIIAADSRTIYKGMDIGTAKPSKADRLEVTHHLLDIIEPGESFTAADFKKRALKVIADIRKRGKLPIVVGGSGLYIDSLIFDYEFMPLPSPEKRSRLNKMTLDQLINEAKASGINLTDVDIKNKRRLIRAIENSGQKAGKHKLTDGAYLIGINLERSQLNSNVETRTDDMFKMGLEKEVINLTKKHNWETEPLKSIGYKEFKEYLEGKDNFTQLRQNIISSSLRLAKKQRTWFKRNPSIQWFSSPDEAYQHVYSLLNT